MIMIITEKLLDKKGRYFCIIEMIVLIKIYNTLIEIKSIGELRTCLEKEIVVNSTYDT
jgi:hypothetical protein